jgi:predicted nuclease of restriction endonuclease-like (RecB) superfamily
LSWTHYRLLSRIDKPEARSFYEIEAAANNWSTWELEVEVQSP